MYSTSSILGPKCCLSQLAVTEDNVSPIPAATVTTVDRGMHVTTYKCENIPVKNIITKLTPASNCASVLQLTTVSVVVFTHNPQSHCVMTQ